MSFIDFTEVKKNVPIEKAVELLGLELKPRNNQLRGPCPVCDGGDRVLVVTPQKSAWYCFGCKTGGDQISLAAHIRGEHPKDAAHYLSGTVPERKVEAKERREKPLEPSKGFKELAYLVAEHEAVQALGIEPEDAERIGLGYAPRGAGRGSVMIPIRLSDGQLIGYVATQELTFVPKEWHY
jgi:DNA primase